MLSELTLHNFALFEDCKIVFNNGLNVLTGETGSGKTIFLEALKFILGERFNREMIRTGCSSTFVEGVFETDDRAVYDILDDNGIEYESTIIISREANINGKNTIRLNGRAVLTSTIRSISALMADIHGQNDNQSLFEADKHLHILDKFGRSDIDSALIEYREKYKVCHTLKQEIHNLSVNGSAPEERIELLKYQIDEIKKASLSEQEEISLKAKHKQNIYNEKITDAIISAIDKLSDSVTEYNASDLIDNALSHISHIISIDSKYSDFYEKLSDISFSLHEFIDTLKRESEEISIASENADAVEERLDLYSRLCKKYGGTVLKTNEYMESSEKELNTLESFDEKQKILTEQFAKEKAKLIKLGDNLTACRKKAADILEKKISNELSELEMPYITFKCNFVNGKLLPDGKDTVEFLMSPNKGEPLRPISKYGSGGEMSRIMLAIKSIIAKDDAIETMVFDEIDTGISGVAAQKIAYKLKQLSKQKQIICITHHAIIAAANDCHYKIEKSTKDDRTISNIIRLNYDESVLEISRLLGGTNISDATKKHATLLISDYSKL